MKNTATVIVLLFLLSRVSLFAEEARIETTPKKSVAVGILLGALAFSNIPGSYGWGNYYARDYRGFWILNIGGSICNILEYVSIAQIWWDTGSYKDWEVKAWEVTACVSLIGSYGFALASVIWGALSVESYNDNVITQKNKISYQFELGKKSVGIEITYRY